MQHYKDSIVLLMFFCISTIVLFFLSRDSYLFEVYGRADSACFFMCGKAWMNGMIPYVDFADSKGPFLWLIYGIAYLIDHYSYVGVFYLSIPALAFTLYFLYLSANILLNNRRLSYIASLLVLFALFNPQIHYETRAETFCWPFISMSLYLAAKIVYEKKVSIKQSLRYIFFLGFAFSACLLIKFTIAFMCLVFLGLIMFGMSEFKIITLHLASYVAGALSFFLPFAIYMTSVGCFDNFIAEYFFSTTQSVIQDSGITDMISLYVQDMRHLFGIDYSGQIYMVLLFGTVLLSLYLRKNGSSWMHCLFPTVVYLWFIGISTMRSSWCYYYESCSPFAIFSIIGLFVLICHHVRLTKKAMAAFSVIGLLLLFIINAPYKDDMFVTQRNDLKSFYGFSEVASNFQSPRIVNFALDVGVGISSNALPACRYWFQQSGESPEMLENRKNAIRNQTADLVTVPTDSLWLRFIGFPVESFLIENGYVPYIFDDYCVLKLYARPGLPFSGKKTPTKRDVIFKRNVFAITD